LEKGVTIGWSHPRNSQDFAPNKFYLFRLLKESLEGLKFSDNQDVHQHAFWTSSASLTEISVPWASWNAGNV